MNAYLAQAIIVCTCIIGAVVCLVTGHILGAISLVIFAAIVLA
jgi:hypothetical protein